MNRESHVGGRRSCVRFKYTSVRRTIQRFSCSVNREKQKKGCARPGAVVLIRSGIRIISLSVKERCEMRMKEVFAHGDLCLRQAESRVF